MGYPNGMKDPDASDACVFTGFDALEENIDDYTCVFKQTYARSGKLTSAVTGEDRPQHWSVLKGNNKKNPFPCSGHNDRFTSYNTAGKNPWLEIQKICTGHKLKTGDLRNQEFLNVKKKKIVTLDEVRQIVNVLRYLILERAKSPKYKHCYNANYAKGLHVPLFNNDAAKDNDNIKGEKISYEKCMYKILDCIKNLQQPDKSFGMFKCADSLPALIPALDGGVKKDEATGIPTDVLPPTAVIDKQNYAASKVLAPYEQACASYSYGTWKGPGTRKELTPTVSKENIDLVVLTLKNDLNDCICYSDCNGYSVCFCYANCNHY